MANIIAEFAFALGLVDNASAPIKDVEKGSIDALEKIGIKWKATSTDIELSWKRIGAGIAGIAAGVGAAVLGAGASLFALADKSTAAADKVAKAARNAGIASDEFQKLAHAGGLADVSSETLGRTVQKLNQQIEATRNGAVGPFDDALRHVGLTLNDLGGTATENLGTIFDALNKVPNEGRRAALAIDLLGKGGREMGSLIAGGSAELVKLGEEAERYGLVKSPEALAASESFQDSLTRMRGVLGGVAQDIGISLAPAIEDVVMDVTEWGAANRDVAIEELGNSVTKLGDALIKVLPLLTSAAEYVADLASEAATLASAVTLTREEVIAAGVDPGKGGIDIGVGATTEAQLEAQIRIEAEQKTQRAAARATRKIQRGRESAAEEALAAQLDLLAHGPVEQSRERAARQTITDQERLQKDFEDKQKKRGKGGKRKSKPADFDAEDFEELEAEELLGEDIDRLARQVGASDAQRQEAISAAARSLAGNASASVALKAAKSRLESLTGATLRDKESDPFLSEVFGEDVPDVQLSQLALGAQPQTLIATINNSFAFDVRQEINGAGNPAEVASQVNRQMVEVWEGAVEKSTKLAKVRFRR